MIGILKEGVDLINYIEILGKHVCGPVDEKELNPSLIISKNVWKSNMKQENKIAFKANMISQFKKKWEVFEVFNLNLVKSK